MKKLEVRFTELSLEALDVVAQGCSSNKSDTARAAMTLGLKAITELNEQNGEQAAKGWIAALNGKVK